MQAMRDRFTSEAGRRPLLTTGAAARIAGCHPTTVLRAIYSGQLEAVRLGSRGSHRIRSDALHQWIRPAGSDNERTNT